MKYFLILLCVCQLSCLALGDNCASIGEKLEKIKIIPAKDEIVDDENYYGIMSQGNKILLCLAEQIKNSKVMNDPRQAPIYRGFTVGDLAFILFVDLAQLDFESLWPIEVQEKWKDQGVYAYFAYVKKPENRIELSKTCREWCEKNLK